MKNYYIGILILFSSFLFAQDKIKKRPQTNVEQLKALIENSKKDYSNDTIALNQFLKETGKPRYIKTDRAIMQAARINSLGLLEYYTTNNIDASKTIGTHKLYAGGSLGLSLDGSGVVIGEWDGGGVLTTHQEFNNTGTPRVTQEDTASQLSEHATHVAGTIVAGGVQATAKGMAFNGQLKAYEWTNDFNEMANEAYAGMTVSNHSYASLAGWYWDGNSWEWANSYTVSEGHSEDFQFGWYDTTSMNWDNLSYLVPTYLIVKAASNDNGDGPGSSPAGLPEDGPYDSIPSYGVAKNILTVGAVQPIIGGYTQPSDVIIASFSSRGPADDGRIKPDIVANGVDLYSTQDTGNTQYTTLSGTSMATPSVTGSIALLEQHYNNLYGYDITSAATKALIIETADEAGTTTGPDYTFGWGLMNTAKAAQKITDSKTASVNLYDYEIDTDLTLTAIASGGNLSSTLVWTDPYGQSPQNLATILDNPTKMLVNDLDMKIVINGTSYYPWQLSASNPTAAATNTAKNNTDNVEKININNVPAGSIVQIIINHQNPLVNNQGNSSTQWVALASTGLINNSTAADAIEIGASMYATPNGFYNTQIGLADGSNTTCTNAAAVKRVWFKFRALAAEQSMFVLTGGQLGTLQNPKLSLWNADQTTLVACHEAENGTNKSFIHATGLTAGNWYYISVDSVSATDAGSFTLYTDASPLATLQSTSGPTPEAGTIRYNSFINKFQGWTGNTWVNFGSQVGN